jgi:formylglycine-generating enzyme required for sulfatase activity
LGVHEVTQAQWSAVMGHNPAVFKRGSDAPQRPVESVSWLDCQQFIARLNALQRGIFRLPFEAEWEYAARAGTTTRFPWGDDAKDWETHSHAWANSRSYAISHPVGQKPPNAWGLHDMHGNVWEWCGDWYGPYSAGPARDPGGPTEGRERVFRGGSWYDFPVSLRSANRHRHVPHGRYPAVGLRLVWVKEERP